MEGVIIIIIPILFLYCICELEIQTFLTYIVDASLKSISICHWRGWNMCHSLIGIWVGVPNQFNRERTQNKQIMNDPTDSFCYSAMNIKYEEIPDYE